VQADGAALGVEGRPHGDGDGAGQGGRGRALQGQRWVRFLGLDPRVGGSPQCGADGPLGAVLQGVCVGLCRWTALHFASDTGYAETAMALVKAGADVCCKGNDGYDSRGCILASFV
jgi:hypothetical protein